MRFSVTRLFDLSAVLGTKSGKDLKELIEYLSQLADQLLRLAQNNITLDDNLKLQRKTVVVKDNTTEYELFGVPTGAPALVLLNTSDSPLDNPIAFNWKYDGRQGKVKVYLKPTRALGAGQVANVEIILFYR